MLRMTYWVLITECQVLLTVALSQLDCIYHLVSTLEFSSGTVYLQSSLTSWMPLYVMFRTYPVPPPEEVELLEGMLPDQILMRAASPLVVIVAL